MATRAQLKTFFETGDFPTQQQFWELIDSFYNPDDDGSLPSGLTYTDENAQDAIASMLTGNFGTGLKGTYVDSLGKYVIEADTGYLIPTTTQQGQWDAGYTFSNLFNITSPTDGQQLIYDNATSKWINSTATTYTNEMAQDTVAGMLAFGTGLSGSYNDAANTYTISAASGYTIPADTSITNWNTAYGWGNHASAGYAKGTGTSGRLAFWSASDIISSNSGLLWNNTSSVFAIGGSTVTTIRAAIYGTTTGTGASSLVLYDSGSIARNSWRDDGQYTLNVATGFSGNVLLVQKNGSNIFYIDDTGRIGVGTTINTSFSITAATGLKILNGDIHVAGSGTGPILNTSDSKPLRIQIGGTTKVGISSTGAYFGNGTSPVSVIHNNGSLTEDAISTVSTSSYTVLSSDHYIYGTYSGTTTVTLPQVSSVSIGKVYKVYAEAGCTITLARSGTDTVDGATSITINANTGTLIHATASGKWCSYKG